MLAALAAGVLLTPLVVASGAPVNIRVVSEGWASGRAGLAEFYIDDVRLPVAAGRGLNVAVLNADGTFNTSQVFDTHEHGHSSELIDFLEGLPQGALVLVAAKDDAMHLTVDGRDALRNCGATLIEDLGYRTAYALIGVKDGFKFAEGVLQEAQGPVNISVLYEEGMTTTSATTATATTVTATATTTTPPPGPCSDYPCPSEHIPKLLAWNITGNTDDGCCDVAPENTVSIMVKSAGWGNGNTAQFYLGNDKVSVTTRRGMNVVVLREDGTVVRSGALRPQTFDTNKVGAAENLTEFLDGLESGTIVLLAAKDDAGAKLNAVAKAAIARCGGVQVAEVGYRDAYALIGQKDGTALAETVRQDGEGLAVAIARLTVEPSKEEPTKPICTARMSDPPVSGWVANNQLELDAGCRYELWEEENVADCLEGSWVTVVGGSNTVLMALRLANMLAPEAVMPVRDGATMGGFTLVDVIVRGGEVVYRNAIKIDGCTSQSYNAACKANLAAEVAEAPEYDASEGGTRVTLFQAMFWDHADAAFKVIVDDTRWAAAPMAVLTQVSTWYIYCAAMKVAWCPRAELKASDLTHPDALVLFKEQMAPVVEKLEVLCTEGGRAAHHGCVVATTSFQNPSSSRLPFYNDYNAAIKGALEGKASEILRIVDLWKLGQAFPEQNILGHGSPMLNIWNWQVMLGGMCPSKKAAKGTFAEFEGDLCFGKDAKRVPIPDTNPQKYDLAPSTGDKCPDYWSACPSQQGSHLRCEPWECANSRPCKLTAVIRDLVVADMTGAHYDEIGGPAPPGASPTAAAAVGAANNHTAWFFAPAAEEETDACFRVWCDGDIQWVPPVVALSLVVLMLVSSKLWEKYAPQHLKEKLEGTDPKKKAAAKAAAGGQKPGEANAKAPLKEEAAANQQAAAASQQATRGAPEGSPALLHALSAPERGSQGAVKASGGNLAASSGDVVLAVKDVPSAEPGSAQAAQPAPAEQPARATAVPAGRFRAFFKKPQKTGDKFPLGLARMMASLHVVVGHLYAKPGVIAGVYFFGWGFTWVPWFFMLSGFVLFTANLRRPKEEGVFEYVMRRSVTIYPLYAVSLIPAFAIAKSLDKAPSAIILFAQSWLLQAWVPSWTESALQMHCWFLSAMVVYWFLFKPLSRCLRNISLRTTVELMAALFFLPWLVLLIPRLAAEEVTWYSEHKSMSTDTWLDLGVVFLKFHPLCYLHVFILGMLLAKLRLLMDAKAVAAGMPRRWRWPMELVAPAGYGGLFLIFACEALQPWGYKLSTRLSVLLPFQAAILFGLAGLPSLPQGWFAFCFSKGDYLENYSYAVYVFQFLAYSVWPRQKGISLPLFLVFLLATAVFVVHTVQRPVQKWWGNHSKARWLIPIVLSFTLGGLELFLPRPTVNNDIHDLRLGSNQIDVRLPLVDAVPDGGRLTNPSLLIKDGEIIVAVRRHRLEITQRFDDGSCAKHGAVGCTIIDQTWHSQILLGTSKFDEEAWSNWTATGAAPFSATVTPWSALRTPEGQHWNRLCVEETYLASNNTLMRYVVTGPEDPKLVTLKSGTTAVAFSSSPPEGEDGCKAEDGLAPVTQMYLAKLSDRPSIAVGHRLNFGSKVEDEKNWVPFLANHSGEIQFAYRPLPHDIIDCKVGVDGICSALYSSGFEPLQRFQREHPHLAEWRGSGNAVLIQDATSSTPNLPRTHYLALIHAVELKTKRYAHFAYRFTAEPPYAILQVSRPLPLQAAIGDGSATPFAFASGLAVHGNVVAITYGAGDRDARAHVMTLARLDELFESDDGDNATDAS